ncbi:MAG: hypothetical protein IJQ43_08580 [Oscillospiraceae bacterium]|nr:hypothetical protein [Oscillospiraceae bacterium]
MNKLNVDSGRLNNIAQELGELRRTLEDRSRQTSAAAAALKQSQAGFIGPASKAILGISDELLTEAAKMQSLCDALKLIAQRYNETEKRLAQTARTAGEAAAASGGGGEAEGDLKTWFAELIAWVKQILGIEDPEKDPEIPSEKPTRGEGEVTRAEERANDLYMQNAVFELLETSEFSKDTWNKASIEQRKAMLQAYMQRVAEIYGVTVASEIVFYNGERGSRGAYSPGENCVRINENYLSRSDSYQIMQTMIHEMRHAYQHAAVEHPESYIVSAETIAAWEQNFKWENYKSQQKGNTYAEYVSQPIEWDAKNFARQYSDLTQANPEYEGSWPAK